MSLKNYPHTEAAKKQFLPSCNCRDIISVWISIHIWTPRPWSITVRPRIGVSDGNTTFTRTVRTRYSGNSCPALWFATGRSSTAQEFSDDLAAEGLQPDGFHSWLTISD